MGQSCVTVPAGSRLPLPAVAKPPLPFPMSSAQLCPHLPVSSTASTISLQGDHQLPLPSLPSLQLPSPPALSRRLLPPLDTECWERALLFPSWMWLPHTTCSSGSLHRVGQGCCCPLVHYAQWSSPTSPALLPLSLVPAACGRLSLALCLPPPPPTHGPRQRAGISCRCWDGDTQLPLLPICHPRGHLPLTSCSSAERHCDENPPTWQKAELNGGGWQK